MTKICIEIEGGEWFDRRRIKYNLNGDEDLKDIKVQVWVKGECVSFEFGEDDAPIVVNRTDGPIDCDFTDTLKVS